MSIQNNNILTNISANAAENVVLLPVIIFNLLLLNILGKKMDSL